LKHYLVAHIQTPITPVSANEIEIWSNKRWNMQKTLAIKILRQGWVYHC